jgi:Flp pilus assembly pilin Flp
MTVLWLRIQRWPGREEGQDLTEYALLIALIILVVVASIALMGTSISGVFSTIASTLASAL